ncbi:hypothetical protein F2Q70_00008849 [Brassica cretica]|uniref:Uncharacterized protein n=1 Tax=Brassica cretica TaxID=69181 RepID=A0A8S9LQS2_BRACR|nr:hypothetical protein F2Q70_00008849 [Brassica cretica]
MSSNLPGSIELQNPVFFSAVARYLNTVKGFERVASSSYYGSSNLPVTDASS